MPLKTLAWLLALVSAVLLASCGGEVEDGGDEDDRVTVVTTFSLLGELAERIGGDRVRVVNLIPLGVDEHAYQPPTTVAREVARADLALVNGYYLEEGLLDIVLQNVRSGVPVVAAARGLTSLEGGHDHDDEDHADDDHADEDHADDDHAGDDHADDEEHGDASAAASEGAVDDLVFAGGDPHFWLDARNFAVYAANVRDALVRVDPDGEAEYRARADEVVAELEALHRELLDTVEVIPSESRRLVVFHDAFQYFAAAYGFEVTATVVPASPNQATSAAAVAEVIRTVRESGVRTVFREPQYSAQSLDLIASDSGTSVGILRSIPSEDAPTYAEMMRANARALVEGLGPS